MKRVININFQGRVVPIEESAYDVLKQYIDSLKKYFAQEEGKDEIINDIEGRIGELFAETLKKGTTCITEDDVERIIISMGRPEDFDATTEGNTTGSQSKSYTTSTESGAHKKLYRDENRKVLGGVCSGIALYFNIEPLLIRILFLLGIFTAGIGIIGYFILWIAVPSTATTAIGSQRKRLYRDPDEKIIGGICSGLAHYFGLSIWVPRVLFLIPFISIAFHFSNWDFFTPSHFINLSFSPGAIFMYILLWILVPEATTAGEKLEMKGEKVDLNNIKNTIQGDMVGFKGRAEKFGTEIKEQAQQWGEGFGKHVKSGVVESTTVNKRRGVSLGDIILMIIKVFAYTILGIVTFSVLIALFAIGIVFTGLFPLKSYVISGAIADYFAWGTLLFFIWIPVLGIVTWIIRKIAGIKGKSVLLRSTISALWVIGWVSLVGLIITTKQSFHYHNEPIEEAITLSNPTIDKLEVQMNKLPGVRSKYASWFKIEPFVNFDEDTALLKNVRIHLVTSDNDSFKVTLLKLANGATKKEANAIAQNIKYGMIQKDSLLLLDWGIPITKNQKFHNQEINIVIAVPVGKRIQIDEDAGRDDHIRVSFEPNEDWELKNYFDKREEVWHHGVEYKMTKNGLLKIKGEDKSWEDLDDNDNSNDDEILKDFKKNKEELLKQRELKRRELKKLEEELKNSPDTTINIVPPTPKKAKKDESVLINKHIHSIDTTNCNDCMMLRFSI